MKERYELWLQQCGGIVPNWRVRLVYRVFFWKNRKDPVVVDQHQRWWVIL